jgi:hypothetical protein
MVKGVAEASICKQKSSKSSSLKADIDCDQVKKQLAAHFEELTDPRGSMRCSSSVYQYCDDCLDELLLAEPRDGKILKPME